MTTRTPRSGVIKKEATVQFREINKAHKVLSANASRVEHGRSLTRSYGGGGYYK